MTRSYKEYKLQFLTDYIAKNPNYFNDKTKWDYSQELLQDYIENIKENPQIIFSDAKEILEAASLETYSNNVNLIIDNVKGTPIEKAYKSLFIKHKTEGIYLYLLRNIDIQINADSHYKIDDDNEESKLKSLLLNRVAELTNGDTVNFDLLQKLLIETKKQPSSYSSLPADENNRPNGKFTNYGFSPSITGINRLLMGKDLKYIKNTHKKINRRTNYQLHSIKDSKGNIVYKVDIDNGKQSHTVLLIRNLDTITSSNQGEQKAFIYILNKINEQAYKIDGLYKDRVTMNLNNFVGEPWGYSSIVAARRYWKKVFKKLMDIGISSATKKKQGKNITLDEGAYYLFTGYNIKNNIITLGLNTLLDWSFIVQFYTTIPSYAFGLSNRSFQLLLLISQQARKYTTDIANHGFFKISYRLIHHFLYLPEPDTIKDPKGKIKDPIEKVINEISNTDQGECLILTPDFSKTSTGDNTAKIEDYLDNSFLKVEFCNDYSEKFINFEEKKGNKIKKAIKAKEKIIRAREKKKQGSTETAQS